MVLAGRTPASKWVWAQFVLFHPVVHVCLVVSTFACYSHNRLPIGPIKVGRPRGANLGSMGNNRRNTVIMR
jgi:hypothetical protein